MQRIEKVYLAGPMRGRPDFNFPAFHAAAARLRAAGYIVFSPAERDIEHGFDPTGLTGNEDLSALGFDLRDALGADVAWISAEADALCLLPGWQASSGTRAEMALAAALGLPAGVLEEFEQHKDLALASVILGKGETTVVTASGGAKGSKPEQFSLIPREPLEYLARHYAKGAAKYGPHNWRRGYPVSLNFDALQRHAWAWWGGEDLDPETGSPHLTAVAWHAFAALYFMLHHPDLDDRPSTLALLDAESAESETLSDPA